MLETRDVLGNLPAIVRNEDGLYEGNIVPYFRAVFFHARNLRNPYHNFRHLCHVLWLCYQACLFYNDRLPKRQVRALLIAALFHDFDHIGSKVADEENIRRAVEGITLHIQPEDREELPNIIALIRASEYPYKVPTESLGLRAQILRDADMAQVFSVAWVQQTVFGLSAEWGKPPLEILKTEANFLRSLKFHTEWAKSFFTPATIEAKIVEINALNAILSEA